MAYPPDPRDSEVTRPAHYGGEANPFEPIKIIEHYELDFCLGNAVKYILRAGTKDGESYEKDLQKAAWYAARAVEQLQPTKDTGGFKHLEDLYDEESYLAGMSDAAGSPSVVLRAVIYALQESGFGEQFIAESDLSVAPTKAVEVERVELNGIPGFFLRVIELAPFGRVNDMELDGEIVTSEVLHGDPGDEHEHVDRQG